MLRDKNFDHTIRKELKTIQDSNIGIYVIILILVSLATIICKSSKLTGTGLLACQIVHFNKLPTELKSARDSGVFIIHIFLHSSLPFPLATLHLLLLIFT